MGNTEELNARMLESFEHIESDIAAAYDAADSGEEYEGGDAYNYLDERPLEIVQRRTVEVVFTLGGPDIRAVCSVEVEHGMLSLESAELVGNWSGRVSKSVDRRSQMWRYLDGIVSTMEA